MPARQAQDLLHIIGERILALHVDAKGRILFVIGTLGIITLYWKTGCLFDASTVGDVGRRLIDSNADALGSSMIKDPLINGDGVKKN